MELQQKHFVSLNVYDIQEQTKTEDIYQTLQTPPTVVSRKASGKKIMVPLLIINILLLTTILLVTAIHYHHFRQSGEDVLNDQKTNHEMWYLHDDTFYLFWRNNNDCETANKFCDERTADLATVTESNREWLQSQIDGKRMLVKMSKSHSSGDGLESFPFMHFWASESDVWQNEHYMEDSGDDSDCELFDATSYLSEQVEGWVCERAAQRDVEPRCMIFGEMPHISEQVVGSVCEKKSGCFTEVPKA